MQPHHPKSKNQLLDWLNQYISNYYGTYSQHVQQVHCFLKYPITKIQQLGNGIAYLLMLHSIDKGSVPLNRILFKTKNEYDNLTNLKLLDVGLGKAKIKKSIDISKLAKMKAQDNLEMLQWFQKYVEQRKKGIKRQENKKADQNSISSLNQPEQNYQRSHQYKQTNQSSYNNSESLMKLAVLSFPQKNSDFTTKPIKLIKEPNPQELRKKFKANLQKKAIASKCDSLKSFDKKQQTHKQVCAQDITDTATFGIPNKTEEHQIKYVFDHIGKREIQDDYEGQLKKVTAQLNEHKIIDEIVDIIYVKSQQKDVSSDGKLAKIQQILFKNGYGGKKTGNLNFESNTNLRPTNKENQMTNEQQPESNPQQNSENILIFTEHQQQKPIEQSKNQRVAVSNRKQNTYQKYMLRPSLKSALLSDHKSISKTAQKVCSNQDYALFETPIGDNENLLEMSDDQKKVFSLRSKKRSSLKKEDLLYLELQNDQMKLLEGGKENNILYENNDVNVG